MKKQFLTVAVAALALAGCSKNETVEIASNRAIGFSNAFVNNGTRSIVDPSLTKTTLENFDVYGFVTNGDEDPQSSQIFDGVKVSKSGGDWTYTPPQYWVKGNTYTFGAIAPAGKGTVTNEDVANGKVTMSVAFNNDGNTDLLHAAPVAVVANEGFIADPQPVDMTFSHQLSKVKFSFKNAVGEGYRVKVTGVKISDAKATGTLTIGETANTWGSQEGTLQLDFGNAVANDDDTEADFIEYNGALETYNEKLMIPTPAETSYSVEFTAQLFQGEVLIGEFKHNVKIEKVELQLGYCYDFAAELTAENITDDELKPIVFTVTKDINGWDGEGSETGLNVPATQLP